MRVRAKDRAGGTGVGVFHGLVSRLGCWVRGRQTQQQGLCKAAAAAKNDKALEAVHTPRVKHSLQRFIFVCSKTQSW